MAITVDWPTKVVLIPKGEASISTIVSVSPDIYEYDLDLLRLELKAIESSEEGIPFDDIHFHTAPFTIGNVQLARVVGIINGYTIEFENGQYQVNYVGANTDFSEAVNRVINQVSVTPQNSAGLITTASTIQLISSAVWETEQAAHVAAATMGFVLNQITYQNKIWLDPLNSTGNAVPGQVAGINGTPSSPVITVGDAKALADALSISTYQILSTTTLDRDHPRWEFVGSTDVLFDPGGYDLTSVELQGLCLVGDFGGYRVSARESVLGDVEGFSQAINLVGDFEGCLLTKAGARLATGSTVIAHSHSSVPGNLRPVVDFNGVIGATLSLRSYSGGLELTNMTDPSNLATTEFVAGRLTLGPTNTGGFISARGIATIEDTSAGTVVDTAALVNKVDVTSEVWQEVASSHVTPGTMGSTLAFNAYQGSIWIDALNLSGNAASGTVPGINGLPTYPVLSTADARVLADAVGFKSYKLMSSVTLTEDTLGWEYFGPTEDSVLSLNGHNINHSRFSDLTLTGACAGELHTWRCRLVDMLNLEGDFEGCTLVGTNIAGSELHLFHCKAEGHPIIDLSGHSETSFSSYIGRIELRGITSGEVYFNLLGGEVTLAPSCTGGGVEFSGAGELVDSSEGTTVTGELLNTGSVTDKVWDEPLVGHSISGSTGEAQASQGNVGEAVLDALLDGHFDSGSVGEALTLIKGLVQSNYMVDSTSFNAAGLMTGGRFRIFDTGAEVTAATDGGTGQGEVAIFTVTAETESGDASKLKFYKVSRN